jgi:hypothetical protein
MHPTPLEILRYSLTIALEAGIFGLALRRGVHHRLRIFTVYLGAVAVSDVIRWVPILAFGLISRPTFWTYWLTQAILFGLRAAVVFELCRYVISPYPGVWKLSRGVLIGIGAFVAVTGLTAAEERGPLGVRVLLASERGLELAVLGVLLFALLFCRYYRIRVDRLSGMLALGLGFYSAVQVANNTFVNHWLARYMAVWQEIRVDAYFIAMLTWLFAIWKPLPEPQRKPALLDSSVYPAFGPQVSVRLRELNARLEELLR